MVDNKIDFSDNKMGNQKLEELLASADSALQTNQISDARDLYRQAVALSPRNSQGWYLLGICHYKLREWDLAVNALEKASEISPKNATFQNTLGATLCILKRFDEAEVYLKNAINLKPDHVEAYRNLGQICSARQNFNEALSFFETALNYAPNHVEVLKAAGNAFLHLDRPESALNLFERAMSINARDANLQTDTGIAFQMQNQFRSAMEFNSIAIAIEPGDNRHWAAFCACVDGVLPESGSSTEGKLETMLEAGDIPPYDLVMPICGALYHRPEFRQIIAHYTQSGNESAHSDTDVLSNIQTLASIPLFLTLLSETPISNLLIEKTLTQLRGQILLRDELRDSVDLEFLSALALQCFNTEYSYFVTNDEKQALIRLKDQIEIKDTSCDQRRIALYACYEPLYNVSFDPSITDQPFFGRFEALWKRQYTEPREEQSLRTKIPDLTKNAGAVSDAVRSQYEENPYPRWVRTNLHRTPRKVSENLQPLNMDLRNYTDPSAPEILVAGCGTGQHALQPATRFSNAHVSAIDLSLSSLAYAKRQSEKLNVGNIDFARADILELASLKMSFDLIECVGVLHHLENPMAGWRVLVDLLRPGGLMKIGLYSELARKDVVAGRNIVAEHNFEATGDGMRACRQFIIGEAAQGNQTLLQLSRRSDFFSLSAFRDLVFHVQEHRFDLEMIRSHLRQLNLEFLEFEMPFAGDLLAHRNSISGLSPDERLSRWKEYEELRPNTFRGMYQFWCRKPK